MAAITSIIIEVFQKVGEGCKCAKVGGARLSSRKDQHVCIREVRFRESLVCKHGDAVGSCDLLCVFMETVVMVIPALRIRSTTVRPSMSSKPSARKMYTFCSWESPPYFDSY